VVKVFDNLRLRLDTVLGYEEILPMVDDDTSTSHMFR
jgi:hypothetical protein